MVKNTVYHSQLATAGAVDRLVINERGRERERERGEMEGERKGEKNREKEKLTGSAPLLPSAIKEVRTQRGGGGGESVGPMLQAQLHVNPIIISHKYLN